MADKPLNMVNLGGIKFNSNDAKDYGEVKGPNLVEKKFFINFQDGTRVEYSEQNKKDLSNFLKGKGRSADLTKGHRDGTLFLDNFENVEVTLPNTDTYVVSNNNKNIKINGGYGRDQVISLHDENIDIKTGKGNDRVHILESKNVNVDTGAGKDIISVTDRNNGQSTGKIKLDDADELLIEHHSKAYESCGREQIEDDKYSEEEAEHWKYKSVDKETVIDKSVEIKGEGVHNLEDTKFSDVHTVVTETTEIWHEEENPNYDPEKELYEDGNDPEIFVTDEKTEKIIKDTHEREY